MKFEIGEIKFEAEGSADLVERERSIFNNTFLPAAIDAIVRTRGVGRGVQYQDMPDSQSHAGQTTSTIPLLPTNVAVTVPQDLSRTTLISFVKKYGAVSEQDFVLLSAHFDEVKNKTNYFTKEEVEKYYDDARRIKPHNISMCLNQLAQKGYIIDATDVEQKSPKPYRISSDGLEYINTYTPKKVKTKKTISKSRKPRSKIDSSYSTINCDELNLDQYIKVNLLKDFKEKMMLVLYIITNEGKGVWFTTTDVLYLMTDIFGESATKDKINGVFTREKLWFQVENIDGNNKLVHRKLLKSAVAYAQSLTATTDNLKR